VSLEDAEAEYQKVMKASGEVEATEKDGEDTPHNEGQKPGVLSAAESSPVERETIDGGLDYQSDELISEVVSHAAGEPSAKKSGGRGMQKKKNRLAAESMVKSLRQFQRQTGQFPDDFMQLEERIWKHKTVPDFGPNKRTLTVAITWLLRQS